MNSNKENPHFGYDIAKISFSYFESHVRQRFYFINFYMIITIALLSSTYLMKTDGNFSAALIIITHLSELFVTFVFFRLEERTKNLIKNSEGVLKEIESQLEVPDEMKVFRLEEDRTNQLKNRRCKKMFPPISYSECFRLLFGMVAFYSVMVIFVVVCRVF